jgi:hypothetical protein
MLPVDLPSQREVLALAAVRADACISLYLSSTNVTRDVAGSRIGYANGVREAMTQLESIGFDKRRRDLMAEAFDDLAEDDAFWAHQARSLAVLATPDHLWTYRLANRIAPTVQVSDRFHVRPLLRAITHAQEGFVLALSENGARLIELFPDMPAEQIVVPDMPRDAASAVGRASINDRSHFQRVVGTEGKKVRLRQYARLVDAALRDTLGGRRGPLILAANEPLGEVFRSVASHPDLLEDGIGGEIDRMTPGQLAENARPLLDDRHAMTILRMRSLHERRAHQGRATMDVSTAARAAAYGAIETLLVDIDRVLPGTLDAESGAVAFADEEGPASYDVLDAIVVLAMAAGAEVVAARASELPPGAPLAASLRYPV